jgi:hypothetical protein
MDTGEKEPKLKTVTTAEIKVWDKDGNLKEHIKINPDGKEERLA